MNIANSTKGFKCHQYIFKKYAFKKKTNTFNWIQ